MFVLPKFPWKSIIPKIGMALSFGWAMHGNWSKGEQIDRLEDEKDVLQEQVLDEKRINQELKDDLATVIIQMSKYNFDINEIPFPTAIKIYDARDGELKRVRQNTAYVLKYNDTNLKSVGRPDTNINEFGGQWAANDKKVLDGPPMKVWKFFENYRDLEGVVQTGRYLKWWTEQGESKYLILMEPQ